jgi:hypothetical protein
MLPFMLHTANFQSEIIFIKRAKIQKLYHSE